jgi:hypothetical protein
MPAGSVSGSTLAFSHEAGGGTGYSGFDVSGQRALLRDGLNVLAIEVHQADASSSDLVFDAELFVIDGAQPPPPVPPTSGGYPARPPQPLGRTVRAADWSDLASRAIATAPLPALLDSLGEPHDS